MNFIKVPFADSGDKTPVPETDAGGGVNMTQGYTQAYALDPATDPSAKRIEREKMNALFNVITSAINEIQTRGIAPFITSSDNSGSAFAYGKGALVSLNGINYQSLDDGNTTTPPGSKWSAVPAAIQPLDSTLTALAALTGAVDKLPYFNGADTAALTALTTVGRDIIGKSSIADVLSYLRLGAGAPPIGIPFFWPSAAMPNTVMDEWSDMVFLKWNDATFSATTYPKLAKVIPSLKLTESRGEFIRTWDDGRGVDAGRTLLSGQAFAIQDINATAVDVLFNQGASASGAFTLTNIGQSTPPQTGGAGFAKRLNFNASLVANTATETRPRNIAFNFLVRAK